jgi:hypothetical protein
MSKQDRRRRILLRGIRAIMKHSFLQRHMSGSGEMPAAMRHLMAAMEKEEDLRGAEPPPTHRLC